MPVDPFLSMGWMVTRRTLNGDVLGPEQGITAMEALRIMQVTTVSRRTRRPTALKTSRPAQQACDRLQPTLVKDSEPHSRSSRDPGH